MSAQPIRTTVLGAGLSLGAFHYPIITSHPDLFTLHSVLERSADLTPDEKSGKSYTKSAAKDRCGEQVRVVKSLEEVTGDEEVELVVIGVPNNLHFEYAKKCMEAGKHGTSRNVLGGINSRIGRQSCWKNPSRRPTTSLCS